MIDNIIAAATLLTTPLLLAAMGGLVNRLGGIVNIGLEGEMLLGALVAALVSAATGSWLVGLVTALLSGALLGWGFGAIVTRLGANEIIAGLGLNVLVAGTIGYVLRDVYGASGSLRPDGLVGLPALVLPGVADVPVLGALISGKDPLTWFAWILVAVLAVALRRTRWGLRLRATGAAEPAARSLGLAPLAIRDTSSVIAGALAALGGAHLSLGVVGLFNDGMVAGRGFIALAAFYFGRSRPWPTAAACALFAVFDATQVRLQGGAIPGPLVRSLPYLVVVVVLTLAAVRASRTRSRSLVS